MKHIFFYTATQLFARVKRRMKKNNGTSYRTCTINVCLALDLSRRKKKKKEPEQILVKLLFSSSTKQRRENWVVFLSTDPDLTTKEILETYALRWGISQTSSKRNQLALSNGSFFNYNGRNIDYSIPAYRSQRAGLPHWAPTSSHDVQT